jgi:AcrR family transcriptional regulator
MAIADEGGIESLSMRRLGTALGVEAMSLYNHVAGKEDILDGLMEPGSRSSTADGPD